MNFRLIRLYLFAFSIFFLPQLVVAADDAGVQKPAGKNASDAFLTAGTNAGTGAMLAVQCPTNKIACVMAALSFAQAASSLTSGKSSVGVAKSVTSPSLYPTTVFGDGITGATIDQQMGYAEGQLAAGIAKLKTVAPKIDLAKGTVETPKGKVPLSSLGSGAAMAKAGLADPSQIAEIDAQLKKMNDFKIPSMSGSTGGGGGGSGGSGKSAQYAMPSFEMPHEPGEKLAAPVAAGLVKLANGEPIGTASDNIFNMIHNRYQKKVQEKIFVGQGDSTN